MGWHKFREWFFRKINTNHKNMSTTNLYDTEAINKIKELADEIDFTLFATNLGNQPFNAVPMSTKKVDSEGNIWFLSGRDSLHNKDIHQDNKVQLMYSKPSSMQFLTVFGEAFVIRDSKVVEELYSKTDDAWFDGKEDPNISAIMIRPLEARYWDPKNNKLVTLFKMGVSAVTGIKTDIGKEGKLII